MRKRKRTDGESRTRTVELRVLTWNIQKLKGIKPRMEGVVGVLMLGSEKTRL